METKAKIAIREVKKEEIPQVINFVQRVFQEVFPFPLSDTSKNQLLKMEEIYVNQDHAYFAAAFAEDEQILGTIAVHPYDDRISVMKSRYDLQSTCEITKCYIDRNHRRLGIGTMLWDHAYQFCQQKGNYQTLYLHTHKFLPGGFPFWLSKGFSVVIDEKDALETIHMEKKVERGCERCM
ncbi:GNAT family N-acetyltransferase [Robertmurraya massiliosenegalensis]|uniref:GNAT family N-acetyltransferase n=1 Tax=Robertmurraya TaxID=2837507 RepID=UPI0039A5C9A2